MRAVVLDRRVQQATNLFTNPSMEKSQFSATSERWRNLFTEPRANITSFSFANNVLALSANRWFGGGGGAGTHTFTKNLTDGPLGITSCLTKTWTGAPASGNGDTGLELTTGVAGANKGRIVTSGEVYTVSYYARTNSDTQKTFVCRGYFYNASGTALTPSSVGGAQSFVTLANGWVRMSATFTMPDGCFRFTPVADVIGGTSWKVGENYQVTGVMVTKTPYLLPFFDGDTLNNSLNSPFGLDYSYAWASTVDLSQTIVTGPTPNQEILRNLVPNPSSEAAVFFNAGAGVGVRTLDPTRSIVGSQSTKFVWTSGAAGVQTDIMTVLPNTTYACSIYCYAESGEIPLFQVADSAYSSAQAFSTVPSRGAWYRVNKIYTTGAAQTTLRIYTVVGSASTFYVDAAMVTATPVLHDYFDGNNALGYWADPDFTPFWTSTVNNSASVMRALVPTPSVAITTRMASSSFRSTGTGKNSIRVASAVRNSGASFDTFTEIQSMMPSLATLAGKTVTFLGKVTLTKVQTGTLTSSARKIRTNTLLSGGGSTEMTINYSSTPPNQIGTHEIRATFTVPPTATGGGFFRLYNGSGNLGEDVFWDDLMLVEGIYMGSYVDGDSLNSKWFGTAHSSQSVGYPK